MPIIYRSVKGSELTSEEVDGNFEFLDEEKQDTLTFDPVPTSGSNNPVTSDGIYEELATKQDELVSGANIKTINSNSLLGSGNIVISTNVADGDYGDITVSSSGAVWTIDNGSVTNAKLAGSIAASKLVGTDIATVGTITAGTWNGSVIAGQYGGTGVNNGAKTITLGGNLVTTGAFNLTLAVPLSTTYTLPNTASETLAGLGTAQTFTLKQTFTAATTEITALTLLDTTYKAALSGASGVLTIGSGFSQLNVPSTINRGGAININTAGDLTFSGTGSPGIHNSSTYNSASVVGFGFKTSGSITVATTGLYSSFKAIQTIVSATGTGYIAAFDASMTITATSIPVYAFYGNIAASGSNAWNLYAPGSAPNHIASNTGIGTTTTTASFLTLGAGTTAKSAMNFISGVAPSSPNNGDIWFDGTDLKMRIGGVTKVFTLV